VSTSGGTATATFVRTFADVQAGEILLYEDAWGELALAVNRGDAASTLGIVPDGEVQISKR